MIPRAHFRCSVFPVRMKNVKNDARGNGVSSWVAVDQASECSRGKRPLPSGPCRVGGRGTGAKPSWGPRRRMDDFLYRKPRSAENIMSGERISKPEKRCFRHSCNTRRLYISRSRTVKEKLGFPREKSTPRRCSGHSDAAWPRYCRPFVSILSG